jgi:CheY-like chemotaxis protein
VVAIADIVLTDIRMPIGDGLWLLEQVRRRARRIPVIALSASSDLDAPALQDAGFDGVLRKPVDMRQLVETITTALRPR